jgi:membrane-bound lytic murein transglycosylase D
LAAVTGTDFYLLKDLNPELKLDIVPYSAEPYILRVPMRTGQFYAAYRDSINLRLAMVDPDTVRIAYDTNAISKLTSRAFEQEDKKAPIIASGTSTQNGVLVYHKVRSGDVVGSLAAKYHVSTKQIQSWNGLHGYNIKVGQQLKVYVPERYANVTPTKAEPTAVATKEVSAVVTNQNASAPKFHVVQNGDTLWDIANSYALSVDRLKELNSLTTNRLEVGQKLRVQ